MHGGRETGALRGRTGAARARAPDGAVGARCCAVGFCRGSCRPRAGGAASRSPPRPRAERTAAGRGFAAEVVRGGSGGHPPLHAGAPEPNKRLLQAGGRTGAARFRRGVGPPERRRSRGGPAGGPSGGPEVRGKEPREPCLRGQTVDFSVGLFLTPPPPHRCPPPVFEWVFRLFFFKVWYCRAS